jgi:hypothetical protein
VLLSLVRNPSSAACARAGTTNTTAASSGLRRRKATDDSATTAAATVTARLPPSASISDISMAPATTNSAANDASFRSGSIDRTRARTDSSLFTPPKVTVRVGAGVLRGDDSLSSQRTT